MGLEVASQAKLVLHGYDQHTHCYSSQHVTAMTVAVQHPGRDAGWFVFKKIKLY